MLSKLMDVEQVEKKSMVLIGIFPAGSQSRPTRLIWVFANEDLFLCHGWC